ncbi:MAG: GSU2403 family nucleotidyltransferase fold protein [Thermodesulfobacteriota bacterium]
MAERLPLDVQTLYAELIEHLTALEAQRTLGSLRGTFVAKEVKGRRYAYLQYSVAGAKKQAYLGPYDETIERLAKRYLAERDEARAEHADVERLCAMLRRGGAIPTDPSAARVLEALAHSGVFRLGGMLVGTHAFAVLGNVLGVHWDRAALRTQDIDLAAAADAVALAMPDSGAADIPLALERLKMGFLPVPPFNPRDPSTSFRVRKSLLRVDLLTPARGQDASGGGAVFLPQWNAAATPLRYLDYLLEEPVRAAIVGHTGVLVNAPAPARLALHKLLTASERDAGHAAKAEKDLAQAGQLIRVLAADRRGDLELAWEALAPRPGAAKRLQASVGRLRGLDPEGHAALAEALPLK